MSTNADDQLCFVRVTEEMKEKEVQLSNAIIARLAQPTTGRPRISEIYHALRYNCGSAALPTKITVFPPDFILHFPTQQMQQIILAYKVVQGPNFTLTLSPWTNEYRCNKTPYNACVTVNIEGIPPQVMEPGPLRKILKTVLLPHCNIQTCDFDENTGICTVIGFAQSPASIPEHRTLALSYEDGKSLHSFPLTLHAETYEDPDAVAEAFEEQYRYEQEMERRWNPRTASSSSSYGCDSSSSFDPNDYTTVDSDREPKLWKDW